MDRRMLLPVGVGVAVGFLVFFVGELAGKNLDLLALLAIPTATVVAGWWTLTSPPTRAQVKLNLVRWWRWTLERQVRREGAVLAGVVVGIFLYLHWWLLALLMVGFALVGAAIYRLKQIRFYLPHVHMR